MARKTHTEKAELHASSALALFNDAHDRLSTATELLDAEIERSDDLIAYLTSEIEATKSVKQRAQALKAQYEASQSQLRAFTSSRA